MWLTGKRNATSQKTTASCQLKLLVQVLVFERVISAPQSTLGGGEQREGIPLLTSTTHCNTYEFVHRGIFERRGTYIETRLKYDLAKVQIIDVVNTLPNGSKYLNLTQPFFIQIGTKLRKGWTVMQNE